MGKILKACRTCLKFKDNNYSKIDPLVRQMLENCVPNIDINLVYDPVICEICFNALKISYEFKMKCLDSESQIKKLFEINKVTTKYIELTLIVRKDMSDPCSFPTKYANLISGNQPREVLLPKNSEINNRNKTDKYVDILQQYISSNENLIAGKQPESSSQEVYQYILLKNTTEPKAVEVSFSPNNDHDYFKCPISSSSVNLRSANQKDIDTEVKIVSGETNNKTPSNTVNNEESISVCPHCKVQLENRVKFKEHLRKNHSDVVYKCEACKVTFLKYGKYKTHIELHETEKYKCRMCEELFFTNTAIKVHQHMAHGKPKPYKTYVANGKNTRYRRKNMNLTPLQCHICLEKFESEETLGEHQKTHDSNNRPHLCDCCGKMCSTREGLRHHLLTHAETKNFVCNFCGKAFRYRSILSEHMKLHTDNPRYKCSKCPKMFRLLSKMKLHETVHSDVKNFRCSQCDVLFKFKAALNSHIKIKHLKLKNYHCEDCGKLFGRSDYLKKHQQKMHKGYDKLMSRFTCKICPKSFTAKDNLLNHTATAHSTERPFRCAVCNKVYATKTLLNQHMNLTHKEQIQCNICGKLLHSKRHLSEHVRIHTGDRPHNCKVCGQRFLSRSNCIRHEKGHAKSGHLCLECYKRFDTNDQLDDHKNTAHLGKSKKYKCGICSEVFVRHFALTEHFRLSHSEVILINEMKAEEFKDDSSNLIEEIYIHQPEEDID